MFYQCLVFFGRVLKAWNCLWHQR